MNVRYSLVFILSALQIGCNSGGGSADSSSGGLVIPSLGPSNSMLGGVQVTPPTINRLTGTADRCTSDSTSCQFAVNPMYAQSDPAIVTRLNQDKHLGVTRDTGWCAPTSAANALLALKGDNPTIHMNSFADHTSDPIGMIESFGDLAQTDWVRGGTYDYLTVAGFRSLAGNITAARKGFWEINTLWSGSDLATYFKIYKPGAVFLLGFSQINNGALERVAGHAVAFNGYSGNYAQIKDPWGRVYYVRVTVETVSNSTISRIVSLNGYSPSYANGSMDYASQNNLVVNLNGGAGIFAFN